MAIERTLSILKPDALQSGVVGKILAKFEEAGLKPVEALAAVTCRAARVLGVRAGTLEAGESADVCLYDPARPWIVQAGALASQGKNTPFQGLELTGRVVRTLVAGRSVYGG